MCGSGQRPAAPASVAEALAMADAAADFLNTADVAGLATTAQGDALVALERLDGKLTAAHANLMAVFAAAGGPQADGAYSAKTWLRHHARVTPAAAGARAGWARRLAAHPRIADALADGRLSCSWTRQACEWASEIPGQHQEAADDILARAAEAGADLADLAALTDQIRRQTAAEDPDDLAARAFPDRAVYLGRTFGGAGRLEGDLAPGAAAAVGAVLDALGGRAGPEDLRSPGQRNHDALAEGCRRLIAAGMLPARAGQDTRAEVAIPLRQLRQLPGAADAEAAWIDTITGGSLAGPEAAAAACDTTLVPMVTGQVNRAALDQLTRCYLTARGELPGTGPPATAPDPAPDAAADPAAGPAAADPAIGPAGDLLPEGTGQRLQATLLRWAIDVLSGPGGLAAHLRTHLLTTATPASLPAGTPGSGGGGGPLAAPSLPLDIGQASDTIPAHLRRAATARDRHCAFPGCQQPPAACQVHHLIPRRNGGPTALHNLKLFCTFHHLIVIHAWGWAITVHPDGTTTATSPGGRTHHSHDGRTHHSHDPPRRTA
jgi:hypothetical protein